MTALLLTTFTRTVVARFVNPSQNTTNPKPPAWFLAGDSTTAVQSSDGGGWGVGFLSFVKSPPAWGGIDYGVNGATTVSFVNGGYWAEVLNAVEENADGYEPFVTIQVST